MLSPWFALRWAGFLVFPQSFGSVLSVPIHPRTGTMCSTILSQSMCNMKGTYANFATRHVQLWVLLESIKVETMTQLNSINIIYYEQYDYFLVHYIGNE